MKNSAYSIDRFATTRWSVVMHAAASSSADARGALAELAQRFWYPIYSYVRRCGHASPIAADISAAFLKHLMQEFRNGEPGQQHLDFRRYLLERLNAFLGTDWKDVTVIDSSEELVVPADLESRYLRDSPHLTTPEAAYQRGFALEVLARAFKRLRSEANRGGHLQMYSLLEPHLARDPVSGEYERIAQQLHLRPLALVVALKRLRQRFRELVAEELADTVSSLEELNAEQLVMHAVMSKMDVA